MSERRLLFIKCISSHVYVLEVLRGVLHPVAHNRNIRFQKKKKKRAAKELRQGPSGTKIQSVDGWWASIPIPVGTLSLGLKTNRLLKGGSGRYSR